MPSTIDLTGKKFGKLTVLSKSRNIGKNVSWTCVCDCGNKRDVISNNLTRGHTKSCGCLRAEKAYETRKKSRQVNEYEIHESFVIGKLKGGKTFIIDLDDFDKIKNIRWSLETGDYLAGYTESGKRVRMHRLIANCPKGSIVDHINHNTLDNRKSNLRICNSKENAKNHKVNSKNKSGFSGVTYRKDNKKWRATITADYKIINLGCFNTKEEAIEARKRAEIKYFKDFRFGYDPNN